MIWPCKQILSIFYHFKNWSWENLPINYRESPFITIDDDVVAPNTSTPSVTSQIEQPDDETYEHQSNLDEESEKNERKINEVYIYYQNVTKHLWL